MATILAAKDEAETSEEGKDHETVPSHNNIINIECEEGRDRWTWREVGGGPRTELKRSRKVRETKERKHKRTRKQEY